VSLRDLAASDHAAIVTDLSAFALPITVTNPAGVSAIVAGQASDVGEVVDPQTGLGVLGRRVTVQILPAPLALLGMGAVVGVADGAQKPWLVRFADIHGAVLTFKVVEVLPDRVLGSLRLLVEGYRPSV
jgi:hypothetical protein